MFVILVYDVGESGGESFKDMSKVFNLGPKLCP